MSTSSTGLSHGRLTPRKMLLTLLAALLTMSISTVFSAPLTHADPTPAQKQAEIDAIIAQLDAWEADLDKASNDYYVALSEYNVALAHLDEAQARVDAAQAVVAFNQERLAARAASMYRNGPLSFLDVLFGATSFSDFATRWDLLNELNRENANLIAQSKSAKQVAELAHAEYAAQERLAAERLAAATAIKNNAEQIVASYEARLASLETELLELIAAEKEAQRAREEAERLRNEELAKNPNGGLYYFGPLDVEPSPLYPLVLEAAYSRLGCPYVWAGNGPDVFDCSGFTTWCFRQAGMPAISRGALAQRTDAKACIPVSEAVPGDLIWWPHGHVAIYIGNYQYIHAPSTGSVVRIDGYNLNNAVALRF